jgi:hypothetical protein
MSFRNIACYSGTGVVAGPPSAVGIGNGHIISI